MSPNEYRIVAEQLAESLADIKSSFGGALNGSPASIAIIRDALMRAASAVDGTPLGPLAWEEPMPAIDPREWGPWADQMAFGLVDEIPDDSDLMLI